MSDAPRALKAKTVFWPDPTKINTAGSEEKMKEIRARFRITAPR
jgi:hypothetical protein